VRIIIYIALLSFISGCTSINISGAKASSEYQNDMTSVYIIFDDFVRKNNEIWSSNPNVAASAELIVKKIGEQSETLWPKKFASYGIQAEVARTSNQKQIPNFSIVLIGPPKSNLGYEMMIKLESVTPRWFGMFNVNFEFSLRDRKNRTGGSLWGGNIELQKGLWPANEGDLASEAADKLISQMKAAGIAQ